MMLRTIAIAFSTYSKIPMPRFEWKQVDMKYTMCAFPLVGLVLAFIQYGAYRLLAGLGAGYILTGVVLTLIPILVTGGIHMDGYMDTWDAICSYGDRDKRLSILKDPHIGAFAVIHCVCYVLLTFAFWHELIGTVDKGMRGPAAFYAVLSGYILSRILSGLYSVTFKKAKKDGMLNDVAGAVDKKAVIILVIMFMIYAGTALCLLRLKAVLMLAAAVLVSLYYRYMSYKKFDGITGDLAGWFLQTAELSFLFAVLLV